jgi:hypothetical protein
MPIPRSLVPLALVLMAAAAAAQAPPSTEVFLAPLASADGRPQVGAPANVSNSPGYDNQPAFTPDGAAVLFTSVRDGAELPDIYRYDLASRRVSRVTATAEGEYSPTPVPDGAGFSVIRVEADGTQRLWRFTMAGADPALVLADVKPVGYHAWIDDRMLALFVLGRPATLQIADTTTGKAEPVTGSIGRSLHRIPGRGTVSFVHKEDAAGWWVKEYDPRTKTVTLLVRTLDGSEDCAWTPDGRLLMAQGARLFAWQPGGNAGWEEVADFAAEGLQSITRLAVSPKGDWLAIVATGGVR